MILALIRIYFQPAASLVPASHIPTPAELRWPGRLGEGGKGGRGHKGLAHSGELPSVLLVAGTGRRDVSCTCCPQREESTGLQG